VGFLAELSQVLLLLVGLLMIMIVLLQRGRGGGLAGAFGGLGGQSAFGTRAGDVFTRITCVIAVIWVLLAGVSGWLMHQESLALSGNMPSQTGTSISPRGDDTATDLGTPTGIPPATGPALPEGSGTTTPPTPEGTATPAKETTPLRSSPASETGTAPPSQPPADSSPSSPPTSPPENSAPPSESAPPPSESASSPTDNP
jgi:preprotein translocase subunit SecG